MYSRVTAPRSDRVLREPNAPDAACTAVQSNALARDRCSDYESLMRDLLDIAADAAERLERHGLVACGRRVNGVTRVDFWTRAGQAHSYVIDDGAVGLDDVVSKCLAIASAGLP